MSTPWGAPQQYSGFMTGEYTGALVLVTPIEYLTGVPTQFGDKDCVGANITVAYHPTDSNKNGEQFANARVWNAAIVGALRNGIGATFGGRITLGTSKMGGQKYTLDQVSDENSNAYLQHYWEQHCEKFNVDKATGQLIEVAKPAPAPSPQAPPGPPVDPGASVPPNQPSTPPAPASTPGMPPPPPPMGSSGPGF